MQFLTNNPISIASGPSHLWGPGSAWGPKHKDSKDLDKILTEQDSHMLCLHRVPMILLALASVCHTVLQKLATSKLYSLNATFPDQVARIEVLSSPQIICTKFEIALLTQFLGDVYTYLYFYLIAEESTNFYLSSA